MKSTSERYIRFYLRIPHGDGLDILRFKLEERENLLQMEKLVLKKLLWTWLGLKQQLAGTTIGTKLALPCTFIFMDGIETEFLSIE